MPEVIHVYDTVKKEYGPLTVENGILRVPGTWDYGPPLESAYLPINGSIPSLSTTAAILYTSNVISQFDGTVVEISAIDGTTGAVKAYPSYDGALFSATPMAWRNKESGATVAGSIGITAIGNYELLDYDKASKIEMRFTASTNGGVTMRGAHWKR